MIAGYSVHQAVHTYLFTTLCHIRIISRKKRTLFETGICETVRACIRDCLLDASIALALQLLEDVTTFECRFVQ